MANLLDDFSTYDKSLEKSKDIYSGLLGLASDGERRVQHPTRNGYVYVRLRDNLSEVVLAFNDKVSPIYNFPVIIQRKNNGWYVLGRDTERYSNWGTSAPFLPNHHEAHEFNRDGNGGGDAVFIYPDQFMPLLCYPSGTLGSGNIMVAPYMLQQDAGFLWVGNTGTKSVLAYRPTNNQAIMGLVYLDTVSGNPGFIINSGTPFSASLTGSSQIYPYIPYPSTADHEPLYAFRLVSGTTSITWPNLYNARQFIGGGNGTGSSSSGSSFDGNVTGTFRLSGIITPPEIVSDTSDYNPTGLSGATVIRVTTGGIFSIDGIVGGVDGRILVLENVNTTTTRYIQLLDEDASSSSAANRFALPKGVDIYKIQASSGIIIKYDGTISRWRLISPTVSIGAFSGTNPIAGINTDYELVSLGSRIDVVGVATNTSTHIYPPNNTDKFGYYSSTTGTLAHVTWLEMMQSFSSGTSSSGLDYDQLHGEIA